MNFYPDANIRLRVSLYIHTSIKTFESPKINIPLATPQLFSKCTKKHYMLVKINELRKD